MTFEEYQQACLRTWNTEKSIWEQFENCALGLGEVGEVQNLLKKWRHHDHPVNHDEMIDELGDVMYYVAIVNHLTDGGVLGVESYRMTHTFPTEFSATVMAIKNVAHIQSSIEYAIAVQIRRVSLDARDIIGMVSFLAERCDVTISIVMERNVAKLLERYPDGFDSQRSINREEKDDENS